MSMDKMETEADSKLTQDRRRFLALRSLTVPLGLTPASSPSPSSTPATTGSTSDARAPTSL